MSIGALDGDPRYIFSEVVSVRILPGDQILVADRSSGTLRVFDELGRFTHQMGGRGEGPGEFVAMRETFVLPPDTIATYDLQAYRLTKFRVDGRFVSTLTFHAPDGYPEVYLGQYSDGGHALAWISQVARDPTRVTADLMRVARFGADGGSTTALGEGPGMRRSGSPVPFSPHFVAAMIGDTVFYSDGVDGLITATGPSGRPIRAMRVTGRPPALPGAWDDLEAVLDSVGVQRLRGMAGRAGLDTIPLFSEMLADDRGRLWLKRYAPATDSHWVLRARTGGEWLVATSDGEAVARVFMPEGFRLMDARGGRVAGVARDSLGVERVQVYDVSTGGS